MKIQKKWNHHLVIVNPIYIERNVSYLDTHSYSGAPTKRHLVEYEVGWIIQEGLAQNMRR